MKKIYQSKRFWTGLIGIITISSMILTGEKSFGEQVPLLVADGFALIQLIIGLISSDPIVGFSKK